MDREHIARLINFDGDDTSTGFVSVGNGSGIDEELTERLRETVNNPRFEVNSTIDVCDARWRHQMIDDFNIVVTTNGDIELTVSREVKDPVTIVVDVRNLLDVVPGLRRLVIDCTFNHNDQYNSCLDIRYGGSGGTANAERNMEFFEKYVWFRSGTPNRLIVGRWAHFESVRGGMYYVPDYDPHKICPARLTTNFLNQ